MWLLSLVLSVGMRAQQQQQLSRYNQDLILSMLHDVNEAVKKNYYDKGFRGLDWEANYKEHVERAKRAASVGDGFIIIAGMLERLNDSHTFLIPPPRPYRFDSGFRIQMIGDRAYIQRVRPGTDADSKLHPGDEVLSFNKYSVNREDLWKLEYTLNGLFPLKSVTLGVRGPDGSTREVTVNIQMVQGKRLMDLTKEDEIWQAIRETQRDEEEWSRHIEVQDTVIWKVSEFTGNEDEVDHLWGSARKHKAVIVDLRGNGGGLVTTLERMVGNAFEHDVTIAERKMRKEGKPLTAKGRGDKAYPGKVIVLIDSKSASASELFARVMQLERRGTVIGDRSEGAVMEARPVPLSEGIDTKVFFACSITDADLIMKDGKSLEGNGVVPDEVVLPSAQDLADGKDPALTRALELVGISMDAVSAGKLLPFKWRPL